MSVERKQLGEWRTAPDELAPQDLDRWYLGGVVNRLPDKAQLASEGLAAILHGWAPPAPIIGADTRVIGVGSCFASYFILWLAERGFNRGLDDSPYNALLRYGSMFESPAVIAQQFRWAFGELDARGALWIGKDKELFEANEERRALVRDTLLRTDVLILTLGLAEVWYDAQSGEPLWRALTRRHYDPARHVFRVESLADTKGHLAKIEEIRARHLPRLKVIYTISPVRLAATFRPVSAISANSASKAILRAALDEFLREHPQALNRELFYFPSYEIVNDFFRDSFEDDNRHVSPFVASRVVQAFAQHYCAPEMVRPPDSQAGSTGSESLDRFLAFASGTGAEPGGAEGDARIAELEGRIAELQRTCDERMAVIGTLDAAARERLQLVERLHGECAALREQLEKRASR